MCLAIDVTRLRRTARPMIGGALLALMVAALPQTARANCVGAADDLQPVVCRSASLAAAWAEIEGQLAEITAAHPDLVPALGADQLLFSAGLDKTLKDLLAEHPAEEVPAILLTGLQDRLAFLRAIEPSAGEGVAGKWQNASGVLQITPTAAGEMGVSLSVSEPIMGLNTCSVEGSGREAGGLLTVALPSSDEISFTAVGQAALGVDYTRAGRGAQGPLRCDDSPPLDGWYFRVGEGA